MIEQMRQRADMLAVESFGQVLGEVCRLAGDLADPLLAPHRRAIAVSLGSWALAWGGEEAAAALERRVRLRDLLAEAGLPSATGVAPVLEAASRLAATGGTDADAAALVALAAAEAV